MLSTVSPQNPPTAPIQKEMEARESGFQGPSRWRQHPCCHLSCIPQPLPSIHTDLKQLQAAGHGALTLALLAPEASQDVYTDTP